MSALVSVAPASREEASVAELLAIAADVVAWIGGRVTTVDAGFNAVGVHVTNQADAEHLARMLWLGEVADFTEPDGCKPFVLWSSGDGRIRFRVFHSGAVVRPVRAFPPVEPWWLDGADASMEAA